MSALPFSKALVSETDAVMVSSGDARENGLLPDRLGETGALPTPQLGVHNHDMQNWDRLIPHPLFPAPMSEQHSSAATSRDAAHMHRRTWWPRQGSALIDASSVTEQNGTSRLLVSALHHAADISQPPQAVFGTVARVSCNDQSDQDQMLLPQQMDDSNRCSKRPAAVSAAWVVHQQATPSLHPTPQECSERTQGSVVEGEGGVCQQLEDQAWPLLQAASTAQQQKDPAQQRQQQQQSTQQQQQLQGQQQQQQSAQQGQQQGHQQQRWQQQQTQGEAELALIQGDTARLQYEAYRESQASKPRAQAQQQQQQHSVSGIAAEQQHEYSSASCSLMCSHAHQHLSNPPRSKEADLHLTLASASKVSEAHMDAVGPFPHRPGQSLCDFYVRTGFCKFGQGCKFDHPEQFAVCFNSLGLPLRGQEATCPFYAKTGVCKFGPSCKFDHA